MFSDHFRKIEKESITVILIVPDKWFVFGKRVSMSYF
jgi:hypothetical protein